MTKLSCGPLWKENNKWENVGCVIFLPRLAHIVNRGVIKGAEPALCCADCVVRGVTGGLRGAGNPTLWRLLLDPILGWVDLPMVLCMIFSHMVLGAIVFGPWFWTRWFSIHGIGSFSMYKYVL